ncbi:unnamed protein product, partial [Ixodes pacificus]
MPDSTVMLFVSVALIISLVGIEGAPPTPPKQDPEEWKFAEKECKELDAVFRPPGQPAYFSMIDEYKYYYYCKGAKPNRVDCTPDLTDKIC